jgi:hypothetical protein
MAIWTAQVETPQRLVIFKRPYQQGDAMKLQVEGFALHSRPYRVTRQRSWSKRSVTASWSPTAMRYIGAWKFSHLS